MIPNILHKFLFIFLRLLSKLSTPDISDLIPGWAGQGSVYHQYISVETASADVLREADDPSLQYQMEKL